MNSRKPRGSGRTPAVGRRGGPFQERDFQRQIGARRGAAAPREEAPFDEDAVPRTRGRRGRGAGVLARRGDRGHGAGDAVLTGHLEDLPHELAQRLLRHLLIDQRHRLPRHHGHDRGAGPQAQRLQHGGLLRHVQTREHEPSRLGVDRVRELAVERLARRVPGHVQVQQHRHLGGELDQLLQQTLVGVRDHPRAAAGAGVGPRRGAPGRGRGAERGQVDGAAQVGRGVGGGLGGHVGHDPSGPGPPRRRGEGRCHWAPR